jgi:uroporphyrinogen-III synthase
MLVGNSLQKKILITRPAHLAANLCAEIAKLGGISECLPLFKIDSLINSDDPANIIHTLNNKIILSDLVICISRNAAEQVIPYLHEIGNINWATIGPATADYLQRNGVSKIVHPQTPPFDSQALLQTFDLMHLKLKNQYILVLAGEHGDTWLQNELIRLDARVEVFSVYRRAMPQISSEQVIKLFSSTAEIDIILITCITSLSNMVNLTQKAGVDIRNKPLLVVSNRIYKYAIGQGFKKVHVAKSMSEPDILLALTSI